MVRGIPRRGFLESSFAVAASTLLPRVRVPSARRPNILLGEPAQFDRALFWRTQAQDAARRGRWKYLRIGGDEMLFDIPNDPGERSDLDIYQPQALTSLREEFRRWNSQMLPRPAP